MIVIANSQAESGRERDLTKHVHWQGCPGWLKRTNPTSNLHRRIMPS